MHENLIPIAVASVRVDNAYKAAAIARRDRDRAILAALDAGHGIREIARAAGLDKSQVSRMAKAHRAARACPDCGDADWAHIRCYGDGHPR